MGVNQMTGTPWHLETLKMNEDDDRRHKSRCIYYYKANKNCKRLNLKCPGSAHCDYYKEDPARIRKIPALNTYSKTPVTAAIHINIPNVPEKEIVYDGTLLYPTGCQVRHKTHGLGIVVEVDNEYVTVDFEAGFSKEFSVSYCAKNALLVREITPKETKHMEKENHIQQELENKMETPNVPEIVVPDNNQSEETLPASEPHNDSTTKPSTPSKQKPKSKTIAFWIVLVSALLLLAATIVILLAK